MRKRLISFAIYGQNPDNWIEYIHNKNPLTNLEVYDEKV
jgi:hypothetical protein